MSQIVTKEGNTKLPSFRARRWTITVNNYEDKDSVTITQLFDKYIIGKEVGEQGTPHLQAYGERTNAVRFDTLAKALPRGHFEKAKGSKQQNIDYCSKERDFITNFKVLKPPKILDYKDLYPWQREIELLIRQQPDERTIHWYWDKKGCAGKTALVKRLAVVYPQDIVFSTSTGSLNILTQADPEKNVYLFNFSRAVRDFDPYGALEQLKDGLITDSKLKKESRCFIMDSPHVICFANKPPNMKKLSADRWKVIRLDEETDDEDCIEDW